MSPAPLSGDPQTTPLYALKADGREEEERSRLNIQHHFIKATFNNRLIFAPVTFKSGDRILDCGTGTGIWPTEIASLVPQSVLVDGADIDPRFFPTKTPDNMKLYTQSTLNLPVEWNNRYKLINQRLMIGAFSRAQWKIAFEQQYRALEPGGWLQIIDLELIPRLLETHKRTREIRSIMRLMWQDRDFLKDGFDEIPAMMKDVGFGNITQVVKTAPVGAHAGELGREATISMDGAQRAMKAAVVKSGAIKSEAFDELLDQARREWDEIPGVERTFVLFCAQKVPLRSRM